MRYRKFMHVGVFIVLSVVISSVAFAGAPGPKPFLPNIPPGWSEIYPDPGFTYGEEHLTPSCSSCPTTDPEYSFFVRKGKVNKVLVFFNGGGACWDTMNCLVDPTYTPQVYETVVDRQLGTGTPEAFSPIDQGIFDFANCNNPFKDWYVVYLPYCTGDLFWGANDYPYPIGEDASYIIKHRGFVNFMAVLDWMKKNFRCPLQVFVTGSSAGGYGAILNYPYIRESFPLSRVYALGDAANGVVGEGFIDTANEKWNIQYASWILGSDVSALTMEDIYANIAAEYPFMKFAQYTTAWDATQSWFYYLQRMGPYGIPVVQAHDYWYPDPGNLTDPVNLAYLALEFDSFVVWHAQMLAYTHGTASLAPNYRYYIGAEDDHTIMRSDKFYTEDTAEGVSYSKWVRTMVDNPFGFLGGPLQGLWRSVEAE